MSAVRNERLEKVRTYGLPYRGYRELVAHLSGEKLTQRKMIWAKCYACKDCHQDASPCEKEDCPLWPYSQYGGGRRKR